MFNAALRAIEGAQTVDALWQTAVAALDAQGVSFVTYLTVARDFSNPVLLTTMPELYELYDPSADPFLHHCCTNYEITRMGAAYLPDYPYLPEAAQTFIAQAEKIGFKSGLGIPVRLLGGARFGGFNMGTRLERAAFEAEVLPHVEQFRLFALLLHRRLEELQQENPPGEAVLDLQPMPALTDLSPREKEIIWLMAKGLSRKEIARSCALSPHTVADYTRSAYRKLGVKNRVEATRVALGV